MLRRLLRLAARILALPALGLAAVLGLALLPGPAPDFSGPPAQTIGLLQGTIHTDLLLPLTPEVRRRFAFAEAAGVPVGHPGARWLVLGWGATGFYTTAGTYADITLAALVDAATGDSAVLRLDVTGPLPALPNLRLLTVSDRQFRALLDRTFLAFASLTPLAHPGFTEFDAFFPAHGRFHALRTCNVWLGATLRASGIPFGLWTPTNGTVALSLWWHAPQTRG